VQIKTYKDSREAMTEIKNWIMESFGENWFFEASLVENDSGDSLLGSTKEIIEFMELDECLDSNEGIAELQEVKNSKGKYEYFSYSERWTKEDIEALKEYEEYQDFLSGSNEFDSIYEEDEHSIYEEDEPINLPKDLERDEITTIATCEINPKNTSTTVLYGEYEEQFLVLVLKTNMFESMKDHIFKHIESTQLKGTQPFISPSFMITDQSRLAIDDVLNTLKEECGLDEKTLDEIDELDDLFLMELHHRLIEKEEDPDSVIPEIQKFLLQ
jgi:hypothetical protein